MLTGQSWDGYAGISVLRGQGDGTLITSEDYLSATVGEGITVGASAALDLNGDARLDLVTITGI